MNCYKELETNVGKFYIKGNKLFDSNKYFVAYVYDEEIINNLKNIKSIEDLVNIELCDNVMWDNKKKDLFENYMETLYWDVPIREYNTYFHIFKDYINKVGNTYFVINFDEI